jgi:putative NADPH-quinone reductase
VALAADQPRRARPGRRSLDNGAAPLPSPILIVQGHPDPAGGNFGNALADVDAEGAASAGHELRRFHVARLDFRLLRTQARWQHGSVLPALAPVHQVILWALRLVFFFPLWMGDVPHC